ncbi:hypothetical protein ACJRPK_00035 [Aquimarina sp. 2-A2]|uniref:hypothetical protein n=1 Tax=Aquimarina sp. 2-A2 TaxID=3382644 RepID=UPI00387F260D
MIKDFIDYVTEKLSNYMWEEAKCVLIFSEGKLNRNIYYLLDKEYLRLDVKPKEYRFFTNYNRELYLNKLENINDRFNKLEVIIFPDGTYKEKYWWDDGKEKQDKLNSANVFYQWLNETMMNRIFDYEKEQGLLTPVLDDDGEFDYYESSWDKGEFEFKISQNKVIYNITLIKNNIYRISEMPLPDYIENALIEHHQITNQELTEEWKPWNTLLIKSPHNDIPYNDWKTYVTYTLDNSIT